MICPNCKANVPEGLKFCTSCGTKLSPASGGGARRFCTRCGKPCEDGGTICRACQAAESDRTIGVNAGRDPSSKKPSRKEKFSPIPILVGVIVFLVILCAAGGILIVLRGSSGDSSTGTVTSGSSPAENEAENSDGYTRVIDDDAEESDDSDSEDTSGEDPVIEKTTDTEEAAAPAEAVEAPAESEEEAEEEPAEVTYTHTYEVFLEPLSWWEAKEACEAKGGHLATVTSEEEYDIICHFADDALEYSGRDYLYLWLGSHIADDSENYAWDNGEAWTFDNWYPGEPSGIDIGVYGNDAPENYLCLWNVKSGQYGWTFNDQRNDLLDVLGESKAGEIGYICEWETEN